MTAKLINIFHKLHNFFIQCLLESLPHSSSSLLLTCYAVILSCYVDLLIVALLLVYDSISRQVTTIEFIHYPVFHMVCKAHTLD